MGSFGGAHCDTGDDIGHFTNGLFLGDILDANGNARYILGSDGDREPFNISPDIG
jgi:hypothetical protein